MHPLLKCLISFRPSAYPPAVLLNSEESASQNDGTYRQKKRNTEKLENGGIPPNIEEMLKAFALRVETLTPSERMVLQYYVDGYTIQEIASLLYISIGTARKHNTNMNRKLGITVREELMLYIELFRKCDQLDKLTYSRTE